MFGIRGASWFLGVSEWSSAVLLFLGPQTELVLDAAGLKVAR